MGGGGGKGEEGNNGLKITEMFWGNFGIMPF